MSLSKLPTLDVSAMELYGCFVEFADADQTEFKRLALWGIHYLLSNHTIVIDPVTLLGRVFSLVVNSLDSFQLVGCHLLMDLIEIQSGLAIQIEPSVLITVLYSQNPEVVRAAAVCLER
jgi:hypothetical protein